jgi:hypothetical protein
MNKKFCDICEAPVEECRSSDIEAKTPWGKEYLGVDAGSPTNSMKQCFITTTVHFGFRAHQSGFGGPPDLCTKCKKQLIHSIWNSLES